MAIARRAALGRGDHKARLAERLTTDRSRYIVIYRY
jgi:hypothetical protein